MNNHIKFIFLSLSIIVMSLFGCKAEAMSGPLDKANAIVNKGSEALYYIGRDKVVDALNGVATAANNLVKNGITLHLGSDKVIPQIGFLTTGIGSSVCGLYVITRTALQEEQKDAKFKYLAGAGMLGVGFASLAMTAYLADK
jgi:hypothetical protein